MPPPTRSSLVPLAVVSAAAFALGWFCRMGAASGPGTTPSAATQAAAAAHAPSASASAPAPSSDAPPTFAAALAAPVTDYQRHGLLERSVAEMDRAEVVAALERERQRAPFDGPDRTLPTEALLARFADLDPAGALLWVVQAYPADEIEAEWLSATLDLWLARDPKAALAWFAGLPAGNLRSRVNEEMLEQLVAIDPDGTAKRVAALSETDSYATGSVFSKLAARDLDAACAQAAQLPPDRMASAVEGIMQFWARDHPGDAYAWAARIDPGPVRDAALKQLYDTWGDHEPAAAASFLTAHGGADLNEYADGLASAWAKRDLAAARAWSENLPLQARRAAVSSVLNVWMDADPRGATEYAVKLPGRQRDNEVTSTVRSWAKTDLTAAVAWADRQGAGSVRNSALSAVCEIWSDKDPRACLEYLGRQPGGETVRQQRTQALSNWADKSPEEVWQWGQGLTDEKQRGEAQAASLAAMVKIDPTAASARLGQLPAGVQADTAEQIATAWMATDPAAATRWAGNLPEGEARSDAVSSVARTWSEYDAKGTAAWLSGQPPGEARDGGIIAMIDSAPDEIEPLAVVRLAQTVQNADQRSNALSTVARNWLNQDRPKATAWIERCHDFNDDQRKDLLTQSTDEDGENPDERTVVTP